MRKQSSSQHRRPRNRSGVYLIELLVALAISGLLAVAMAASLSEQLRATTGAENQLKAAAIAQQLIDRIRGSSQSIPAYGVYPVPVDSDDGTVVGSYWFQQRPLGFDVSNLSYPNLSGDRLPGPSPNGRAIVNATFAPGSTTTTSLLTITITWSETSGDRSAVFTTTLSKTPSNSSAGVHL